MFRSLQQTLKDLQETCSQIAYSFADPVPTSTPSSEVTPRTRLADEMIKRDRFILNRYPWASYKAQSPAMQRALEVAVLKEVIQYSGKQPKGASPIDNEVYSTLLFEYHEFREILLECWEKSSFQALRITKAFHAFAHSNDTALPMAAQLTKWGVVNLLLEDPSTDVNRCNDLGATALVSAAFWGHESTVQRLLAHPGIDVELADEEGWTPLMVAASRGHTSVLKLFLERRNIQVNAQENSGTGMTALIAAASEGHDSVVQLLLEHPATDVNRRTETGHAALSTAAFMGHESTVQRLLAHPGIDAELADEEGWTPLMVATLNGHTSVLKLFLERQNIHVNAREKSGMTALIAAALTGADSAVQLLLEHPTTDVNLQEDHGWTALFLAAKGHEAVVKLLLKHGGIEADTRTSKGTNPLSFAAEYGYEPIVRLLLDHGSVNVNNIDDGCNTPLSYAACNGHTSVAKLLLEQRGIEVNFQSKSGRTALSRACGKPKSPNFKDEVKSEATAFDVVQLLLTRDDIDVNLANEESHTPLYYATQSGFTGVVDLLRSKGAVIDQAAGDGAQDASS